MLASLHWKYPLLTAQYAEQEDGIIKALWHKVTHKKNNVTATEQINSNTQITHPATAVTTSAQALFEKDQLASIEDDINEVVQFAMRKQLPALAIRSALESVSAERETRLNQQVAQACDNALAKPGSAAQRSLATIFAKLSSVLPLLAICWAGYRIVNAFYEGGSQPAQYLGSSFAINAGLLIAMSWLLPFVLARKLKPSLPRAASKGMQRGAIAALDMVKTDVHSAIDHVSAQTLQTVQSGRKVFENAPANNTAPAARELQRVLI